MQVKKVLTNQFSDIMNDITKNNKLARFNIELPFKYFDNKHNNNNEIIKQESTHDYEGNTIPMSLIASRLNESINNINNNASISDTSKTVDNSKILKIRT